MRACGDHPKHHQGQQPQLEVGRSKIFEELLYQSVPQDFNSKVPTPDLVPKGKM